MASEQASRRKLGRPWRSVLVSISILTVGWFLWSTQQETRHNPRRASPLSYRIEQLRADNRLLREPLGLSKTGGVVGERAYNPLEPLSKYLVRLPSGQLEPLEGEAVGITEEGWVDVFDSQPGTKRFRYRLTEEGLVLSASRAIRPESDWVKAVLPNERGDLLVRMDPAGQVSFALLGLEGNRIEIPLPTRSPSNNLPLQIDFAGLNNRGVLCGRAKNTEEDLSPVIWSETSGLVILEDLFPDTSAGFNAIADNGSCVGSLFKTREDRAFTWSEEEGIEFLHEDPHAGVWPLAINHRGEVVGAFSDTVPYPGFFNPIRVEAKRWQKELYWFLKKIPLRTFRQLGYQATVYYDATACLWRDGILYNLEETIPEDSEWDRLLYARDINDRGQITGVGLVHGVQTGFLMTPEPTPLELENR